MKNLLEIRNLTKTLGTFQLKSVNLDIPEGTITGLIGANGAGKSTIIKLILGLLSPDSGDIKLFGENAQKNSEHLRVRVGFVQESPTLYSHLNILDLGHMVAHFYPSWNEGTFQYLCSLFELPVKNRFQNLSQGARMKTALAIALSHDADLLVLDEPTSGLDPLARREVLDLLRKIVQDNGKAVIFSTHITSDLDRVADRVAIMKEGKLLVSGLKNEVLKSWILVIGGNDLLQGPLKEYCRGFIASNKELVVLCENIEKKILNSLPNIRLKQPNLEDILYYQGQCMENICLH